MTLDMDTYIGTSAAPLFTRNKKLKQAATISTHRFIMLLFDRENYLNELINIL